jgi:transposase
MRPTGSQASLERRRRRALQLLDEGWQPVEVARKLGVDRRSVRRWRAAFDNSGAEGLSARPVPGRPSKLDAEQIARLERLLLKGARRCGFPTDLWTCRRVAELIDKTFGVDYHVDHIGRLLRRLGWTPQKPARRARERDEARIRGWVQKRWPQVKKTPRA